MRFLSLVLLVAFAAVGNAHFQLQYPMPRGPFVMNSEPTFCDGYDSAVQNRTVFPLSNGIIDLNSEHPQWTVGVIISTKQDPTSFSDFNSSSGYQVVVPYFQTNGEGLFCFPINISAAGISGVQDGANVTIQIVFDGGDGTLYQCADLTLSSSATVPSNATSGCTNISTTATTSFPSATASPSATATSNTAGKNAVAVSSIAAIVLASLMSLL